MLRLVMAQRNKDYVDVVYEYQNPVTSARDKRDGLRYKGFCPVRNERQCQIVSWAVAIFGIFVITAFNFLYKFIPDLHLSFKKLKVLIIGSETLCLALTIGMHIWLVYLLKKLHRFEHDVTLEFNKK